MPARKKGKGLLSLFGLGRKKVVRRRRGRGIADIIGGIGRGVGSGLGGGLNSLVSGLFGGARKKVARRRRVGRSALGDVLAYASKAVNGGRRRRRGGERFDEAGNELPSNAKEYVPSGGGEAPKTLIGKLNKTLRDSGVISKGLKNFGWDTLATGANAIGYGRRRGRGYRGLVF